MHLSASVLLTTVHSKVVVLLLLIYCQLLLPLWGSVFVPCFVVHCFVSFLVLQSSWWGRESWLLYLVGLPGALCLLLFCGVMFLVVPWVGLQCVIVVFPDHNHLLFCGNFCKQFRSRSGRHQKFFWKKLILKLIRRWQKWIQNNPACLELTLFSPWEIFHAFLSSADFFQNQFFFEKFFQEYHQSVKQIESRSGPTLCWAWSGSTLFAKVISRGH